MTEFLDFIFNKAFWQIKIKHIQHFQDLIITYQKKSDKFMAVKDYRLA